MSRTSALIISVATFSVPSASASYVFPTFIATTPDLSSITFGGLKHMPAWSLFALSSGYRCHLRSAGRTRDLYRLRDATLLTSSLPFDFSRVQIQHMDLCSSGDDIYQAGTIF